MEGLRGERGSSEDRQLRVSRPGPESSGPSGVCWESFLSRDGFILSGPCQVWRPSEEYGGNRGLEELLMIRKVHPGVTILVVLAPSACSAPPAGDSILAGADSYLGQSIPGDTAVVFAPGLVSKEGRYEYGLSISPDGQELLVSAQPPDGPTSVMHFRVDEDPWVELGTADLTQGGKAEEMEAFFTPDGQSVYFAPYDEGMDVRIWSAGRGVGEWLNPQQLPDPVAEDPAFFPTSTLEGVVYYSNLTHRRIYRAWRTDGSTWVTEDTGLEAMHAFIAPDESFVLLDIREGGREDDPDIFVSRREEDGSWSTPVKLGSGVNSDFSETCPSLSPDGRFLFFSRYNEPGGVSNIYWVGASVISEALAEAG